jgi:hypothetical protein
MSIAEADPWRLQYFEGIPCPPEVRIPTEDADAWEWFPRHRWIYNKLDVALSQKLEAGPHGVMPRGFPVFSKPMMNLKGMGVGSTVLRTPAEYERHFAPGHMWMPLFKGDHISSDFVVLNGRPMWWRHATGLPFRDGMFDYWTIHAEPRPALDTYLSGWIAGHLAGYTGMVNFETIGGRIIEAHLRFADQWPDCYGPGWVEALIRLYAEQHWEFAEGERRNGYSIALFGRHGRSYRHPPAEAQAAVLAMPGVSSLQITFHETKPPEQHAMPPGGFRLALINGFGLETGLAARRKLAEAFPADAILWPPAAQV